LADCRGLPACFLKIDSLHTAKAMDAVEGNSESVAADLDEDELVRRDEQRNRDLEDRSGDVLARARFGLALQAHDLLLHDREAHAAPRDLAHRFGGREAGPEDDPGE